MLSLAGSASPRSRRSTTVVVGLIARPILYAVFHDGSFSIAAWGWRWRRGVVYDALVGVISRRLLDAGAGGVPAAACSSARARALRCSRAIGAASVFGAFVEWFFFEEFNSRFNNIAIDYVRNPKEVFGNIGESYHVTAFVVAAVVGGMLRGLARDARHTAERPASRALQDARQGGSRRLSPSTVIRGGRARSASVRRVGRPHRQRDRPERRRPSGARGAHGTARLRRLLLRTLSPLEAAQRRAAAVLDAPWIDGRASRSHRRPVAPALGRRRDRRRELRERVRRRARTSLSARRAPASTGGARRVALDEPDRDRQSHRARIGRHALLAGAASRRGGAEADEERDRARRSPTCYQDEGYKTAFLYGGWGRFDDMKPFFPTNGFDEFIERDAYPDDAFRTIWGVADEWIFAKALERAEGRADRRRAPLHDGADREQPPPVPCPRARHRAGRANQGSRESAVAYADWALADYLDKAKAAGLLDHTVVLIEGDHGARGVRRAGDPDAELPHPRPLPRPRHRVEGPPDRPRWRRRSISRRRFSR